MKKNNPMLYFVVGVLIVLAIGYFAQSKDTKIDSERTNYPTTNKGTGSGSTSSGKKPTDSEARFMAEDICKSQLKSPSSAKWGKTVNVTSLGNNKYSVSGTVEAQNSFGAMIMNEYYAYFTFTGQGYKEGYCSITSR